MRDLTFGSWRTAVLLSQHSLLGQCALPMTEASRIHALSFWDSVPPLPVVTMLETT